MRTYGKEIEISNDYYEVPYTEYRTDGTAYCSGTEDFSLMRWARTYKTAWIWVWDGKRRNKGGYRWFECVSCVRYGYGTKADLKKVFSRRYPDAAEIQVR